MIQLAAAIAFVIASAQSGTWSQYGKTPTDGQIWYHTEVTGKLNPHRDYYDGYIAVEHCEHVGKDAIITVDGQGPFLVFIFDCAVRDDSDGTRTWMQENGIIGELGWYLKEELNVPDLQGVPGTLRILEDEDYNHYGSICGIRPW